MQGGDGPRKRSSVQWHSQLRTRQKKETKCSILFSSIASTRHPETNYSIPASFVKPAEPKSALEKEVGEKGNPGRRDVSENLLCSTHREEVTLFLPDL